jgi:type III restriction enzyme
MLASYFPDFMVKTSEHIYLVETKAQDQMDQANVKQKQLGAIDWVSKVNELDSEDRMNRKWHYILLGEETFYSLKNNGASIIDIFDYCELSKARVENRLF